uniref:Uncharacterized protein n=1 Tax=Gorilla gorilla gorilla TaxID=9595 RepID=A0A2I2ZGE9_GORGO
MVGLGGMSQLLLASSLPPVPRGSPTRRKLPAPLLVSTALISPVCVKGWMWQNLQNHIHGSPTSARRVPSLPGAGQVGVRWEAGPACRTQPSPQNLAPTAQLIENAALRSAMSGERLFPEGQEHLGPLVAPRVPVGGALCPPLPSLSCAICKVGAAREAGGK